MNSLRSPAPGVFNLGNKRNNSLISAANTVANNVTNAANTAVNTVVNTVSNATNTSNGVRQVRVLL